MAAAVPVSSLCSMVRLSESERYSARQPRRRSCLTTMWTCGFLSISREGLLEPQTVSMLIVLNKLKKFGVVGLTALEAALDSFL